MSQDVSTATAEETNAAGANPEGETEAGGIKIAIDKSKQPRFATVADKEQGVAQREELEPDIRKQLLAAGYIPEYLDEVITTLFEGRTLEEPPEIPKNISLYGRPADEIAADEKSDLHNAYDEHMESHWGF